MRLREEALKAYQEYLDKLSLEKEKENKEKEQWIIERLLEIFDKELLSNLSQDGGFVYVDGVTFFAIEENHQYRLGARYGMNITKDVSLIGIGRLFSDQP